MTHAIPMQALVVGTKAADHRAMIAAAAPFFRQMAADHGFGLTFTDDPAAVSAKALAPCGVFVMLHLAPFELTPAQQAAVQAFVEGGGGWVGVHAAGLTGRDFVSPSTPYWQWYEDFLGGITYSPHPFPQRGTVIVEDRTHPATRNLPERFEIPDEWYEFSASPRGRVHVLAVADESTYTPNRPMGDHPLIWTSDRYGRAIYIGIGHGPELLSDPAYSILLRDAVLWAGVRLS